MHTWKTYSQINVIQLVFRQMITNDRTNRMGRITVKDIARELNISAGTVSKALSGKKGVSDQMRGQVYNTARKLGYSINILAQGLARKPVNVRIVMPSVWGEFYGYLRYGIEIELNKLIDQKIYGKFDYVSGLYANDEYRSILGNYLETCPDAVIICPALTHDYMDILDAMHDKGIKTIILGNSLAEGKRFTEIRIASEIAGSLAAEYASILCEKKVSIAVFIGNKDMEDHRIKLDNFLKVAKRKNLAVSGVYETQDDVGIAYLLAKNIISAQSDLGVIYVATVNSVAVCKCIVDMGVTDKIKVIATDIFTDMDHYVQSGVISATIYQNQIRMGRMAIKEIYNSVTSAEPPDQEILVYPHLVMQSNYSVYSDYLKKVENGLPNKMFE